MRFLQFQVWGGGGGGGQLVNLRGGCGGGGGYVESTLKVRRWQ